MLRTKLSAEDVRSARIALQKYDAAATRAVFITYWAQFYAAKPSGGVASTAQLCLQFQPDNDALTLVLTVHYFDSNAAGADMLSQEWPISEGTLPHLDAGLHQGNRLQQALEADFKAFLDNGGIMPSFSCAPGMARSALTGAWELASESERGSD